MNVLALETATTACSIALRGENGDAREVVLDRERRHTETLMPGIARLLAECGLGPSDLTRVVVDRGPGLYTGLRVGVATAIGLTLAAGAELVAVTSLEVLARDARDRGVDGTLLAAVDGRRGELFVQTFSIGEHVVALSEPTLTTPDSLIAEWSVREESLSLCGDGVARYAEQLWPSRAQPSSTSRFPRRASRSRWRARAQPRSRWCRCTCVTRTPSRTSPRESARERVDHS